MKIDRKDAHDRFLHFTSQNFSISECCQDLINQRPFGNHPFYIFVHARTDENINIKRLIWAPRLTKPKSQTNSMLFKAYPGTDLIKIIWMIPERSMWDNYKKGKMVENQTIYDSILAFENNRELLDKPEDDDLTDPQINEVYRELAMEARRKRSMEKLWAKV